MWVLCGDESQVLSCSGCTEESCLSSTCPIQPKHSHSVTLWFSTGIRVWAKTPVKAQTETHDASLQIIEQTNPQIDSRRLHKFSSFSSDKIKKGLQLQASGWNSKLSSRASLLSVPSPTSRAQTLHWPLQLRLKCSFKNEGLSLCPLLNHTSVNLAIYVLVCQHQSKAGLDSHPLMPQLYGTLTSHLPAFFVGFFCKFWAGSSRQ